MSQPIDQPEAKPCPHCKKAPVRHAAYRDFHHCAECNNGWINTAIWNSRPIEDELRAKLAMAEHNWQASEAELKDTREGYQAELQRVKDERDKYLHWYEELANACNDRPVKEGSVEGQMANGIRMTIAQLSSAQKEIERLRAIMDNDRSSELSAKKSKEIAALQSELDATKTESDEENARWQEAIYQQLCRECPDVSIDGGGCDSGDPLDLTLVEISQVIGTLKERGTTLRAEVEKLRAALEFYADPATYFGIMIAGDEPCGEFMTDSDETELGMKPGKTARTALSPQPEPSKQEDAQ